MPFCINCGEKIVDDAKFCHSCGAVQTSANTSSTQRKFVYEGTIHKCPNCGEIMSSFIANCPVCGYELRDSLANNSVQQLYQEINNTLSVDQKTSIIRNFPIPNDKENILEFMILASSNISGETDKNLFEAWIAKFEQAYQKAKLSLSNDSAFSQIEEIYENTEKSITRGKITYTTSATKSTIANFFKAMPNPIFAFVLVILIIFNIIRLIKGEFAGLDVIFDVVILSVAYKVTIKKDTKSNSSQNPSNIYQKQEIKKVKIPFDVIGGTSENYVIVETLFIKAGFVNIKSVPLNDLTFGIIE